MEKEQPAQFQYKQFCANWCSDCATINLRIGHALFPIQEEDLSVFINFLESTYLDQLSTNGQNEMTFQTRGIVFSFNENDASDLISLLSTVHLNIKRAKLEDIFKLDIIE